jgi:hypothetical protein
MVARSLRRELARHHFPKAQTILAEIGIVIRRCNWPGRLPAERIPSGVASRPTGGPDPAHGLADCVYSFVPPHLATDLRAGMGHGVAHRRAFTDTCLVDESSGHMAPAKRTPDVAPRSSGCAALGAAVGEVQGQQALAEGAVGRRLIARRVVGSGPTQVGTHSTTESWFGPRKNGIAYRDASF